MIPFRRAPCALLARPLRWLPSGLHSSGLSKILSRVFADALASGEMDFLQEKTLHVAVVDLRVNSYVRLECRRFVPAVPRNGGDIVISAELYTFLLLATQREDADSLFFQRLLRIEGDTATGLHLKNFIDALEEPPVPRVLREALDRMTDLIGRYCGAETISGPPRQVSPETPRQ